MKTRARGNLFAITMAIVFLFVFATMPMYAQLTYSTENSIDIGYGYGGYYYGYSNLGSLVGTLNYSGTGDKPDSLNFSGSSLGFNGVTFTFQKSNGSTYDETIDASCYITYYKNNGSSTIIQASSTGNYTLSRINWDYPMKFYLFFDNTDLYNTLRYATGTLVSVSTNTYFNPLDDNEEVETLSNMGTTTQQIPLLGGGLVGPYGINSIPATNLYYSYDTSDVPEYNINFTESDVYIEDLSQAIGTPINITNLKLEVLNYDDVYMGQTNVQVKFYQSLSTYFALLNNSGDEIPFSLSASGSTIIPYVSFFPWTTPLIENNFAPIGFSVNQEDYELAEQGDYTATITVELITGI
jgi:hypothetical protein